MGNSEKENKIQSPGISLPKGGGAVKGVGESFEPNRFSGTGAYSISVPLTPARGLEPELSLVYDSGSGNDVFGLGFSLSSPGIFIKTDTGIPEYNESDIYILTGEDELTPRFVNSGGEWVLDEATKVDDGISWNVIAYQPREQSSFSSIEQYINPFTGESWWEVVSRENITHQFGKTAGARVSDPADSTKIFEWLIEESFDSRGNKVLYRYKPEDGENISPEVYETNRSFSAKKYIEIIQYGNYASDVPGGEDKFAFSVVFDYGEYDSGNLNQPGSDPYKPVRTWPERLDPFSSYRSGFEIRTCRLCKNILIFHNFSELGSKPCLVKALRFAHEETPIFSFLKSVTETGYRINPDGSYSSRSIPPLEFEYSSFAPSETPEFKQLTVDGGDTIPGYLDRDNFQPIDLRGEGLPGMLVSNAEATLYYDPLGNGEYQFPGTLASFPVTRDLQNPVLSLQSLEGNGKLELVVSSPGKAGYFSQENGDAWSSFHDFQSVPTDLAGPYTESVDLDGNGRADLLVFYKPDLLFYQSEGKIGYGIPRRVSVPDEFPCATSYGERELVTFADIFGDGLSHRVRVRDGSVEAWPNLGYGRFGNKVTLANAPRFDPIMKVSRILLADVDGSGTGDLAFIYSDRVDVYLNQIGNSFASEPITVYLPDGFDEIDQIQFVDILGEGTSALVFTQAGPDLRHSYYNFSGDRGAENEKVPALKPYLLTKINNNSGAVTEVHYASSTKFYLEDKKAGRPGATRLPFPVQVVEKTISTDEISGSRLTSTYKYHDGYYDPVERRFRGFGFVESWDTETLEEFNKSAANPEFSSDRLNEELYVPPVYTKTWHHTGAFFEEESITRQYAKEYFQGDKDAYPFPDSVFDPAIFQYDSETIRQAYAALKGTVMRQEVYGLDSSALQNYPYSVTESNVAVVLMQPVIKSQYAVFQVNPHESISYYYERNPDDPRIQQEFTLEIDPLCGETKKSCTVYLPRRSQGSRIFPEQKTLKATARYINYINTSDTEKYRYRGVPYQIQEFEISGLDLNGKQYFSSDDMTSVASSLENPVPYQGALSSSKLQARQLTWKKSFFWDEDLTEVLELGKTSSRNLLHHRETAVFTKDFISEISGQQLTDDTIQSQGGYIFDFENGYWWNKGLTQFYLTAPASFYSPHKTENSFVDASSELFLKSEVEYDQPYYFSVVKSTQYIDEANKIENTVTSLIDYVSLQPYQMVDINGNVSQVLFDPLGQVIVTTRFGTENGVPVGGMRLYPYGGAAAEYISKDGASFEAVLANPEEFLQGATAYFYYNLLKWKETKQPLCSIELIRNNFYHLASGLSEFSCKTSIQYTDGSGRNLESKLQTDPGMAIIRDAEGNLITDSDNKAIETQSDERWIVSGKTVYNNKGKPCEQYLPYFSNTPVFETGQEIIDHKLVPPPTVTHYDPLLRVVRIDTPRGFFSRVEFSPWEQTQYDEDDTVKDSYYYIDFLKNYPSTPTQLQKDEKDALEKAAQFYNTPSTSILDNTGTQIRAIVNNLGSVSQNAFKDIVSDGVTSSELYQELISRGYLQTSSVAPIGTWVTDAFQPYIPGFTLELGAPYQQYSGQVTELLKQNCLMEFVESDIQSRVVRSIDPRLYYVNQTAKTDYYNFKYRYAMGEKDPVLTDSVDAGSRKHVSNIFGNPFWSLSARNYCQSIAYDRLQRRIAVKVKELTNEQPITSYSDFNLVEVTTYGETPPQIPDCNLRGRVYQFKDLSGIVTSSQYSLKGKVIEMSRQLVVDYKTAIDWNKPPSLEKEIYNSQFFYDARDLLIAETTPDGSITTNDYSRSGLLNQVRTEFVDKSEAKVIERIEYDASGQRTSIRYGNGIVTSYFYEPTTLYLTKLFSTRPKDTGVQTVQDIDYTYDPAGNITRSWNNTFKTVFNNNQSVDPLSDYTYDALYRLTESNGRQHPGINGNTFKNNSKDGTFKQCIFSQLPPVNDAEKLENYSEVYTYDDSSNLIKKEHRAPSVSWVKETPVAESSNRLMNLEFDASGNMQQLDINNPVSLSFNYFESLVSATVIERPDELDDCDYYVYGSGGMRNRKVSERMAHGGAVTLIEEKIYIGNYEIKRNISVNGEGVRSVSLERETLRIMGGSTCAAIVHSWKKGADAGKRKIRFQMSNNLGSITSEYDTDAQLISYEEYFPYGGTAIIAGSNQAEVKLKEYRYSGKERDDSTGLYYYGTRYYAPWLGRWLNPDPAGTVDGLNVYTFVKNNPLIYKDPDGMARTRAGAVGKKGAAIGVATGLVAGAAIGATVGFFLGAGAGALIGAGIGAAVGAIVGGIIGTLVGRKIGKGQMVNPLTSRALSTTTDIHFGINTNAYDATPVTVAGAPAGFDNDTAGLGKRTQIMRQYGGTVAEFPWDVLGGAAAPAGYYDPNHSATVTALNHLVPAAAPGTAKSLRGGIQKYTGATKDTPNPLDGIIEGIRYSKGSLAIAASQGHVHFHLDDMGTDNDIRDILNKLGPHKDAVTSSELRYVKRFWAGNPDGRQVTLPPALGGGNLNFSRDNVTLYRNAVPLSLTELRALGFN